MTAGCIFCWNILQQPNHGILLFEISRRDLLQYQASNRRRCNLDIVKCSIGLCLAVNHSTRGYSFYFLYQSFQFKVRHDCDFHEKKPSHSCYGSFVCRKAATSHTTKDGKAILDKLDKRELEKKFVEKTQRLEEAAAKKVEMLEEGFRQALRHYTENHHSLRHCTKDGANTKDCGGPLWNDGCKIDGGDVDAGSVQLKNEEQTLRQVLVLLGQYEEMKLARALILETLNPITDTIPAKVRQHAVTKWLVASKSMFRSFMYVTVSSTDRNP
ncbi:hypothetical protein P3T76_009608 [Phytophthora citrophthora]|uniref:Uncharacterized protein n=1 Tax=Phytophthora citrophthora TaxID=4793 RepID=A0AAD9GG43_9STRA|nr:hypothetical protein P3T76_009608 [Phytophthora citrophthora]